MSNSKIHFLLIIFLSVLIISPAIMGNEILSSSADNLPDKITCEEALKNSFKIKVGFKESEVIDLIGDPANKSGERWDYSFAECAAPLQIGTQTIFGVSITFKEKVVDQLNWAWIDMIGSPSKSPPKKQKKKAAVRNNSKCSY